MSRAKRPKRLWIVCGMNIFASIISLFVIMLMFVGPSELQALRPDALEIVFALSSAAFLLVASTLGLLGVRQARWLILVSALNFYGGIAGQNLFILSGLAEELTENERLRLWSHVGRSTIEVSLNIWMCLSRKVIAFFAVASSSSDPKSSMSEPRD